MKEIIIQKPYSTIQEVDSNIHPQFNNVLRVWKSSREEYSLQIRAITRLGKYGRGKKRKMIATLNLSLGELKSIIKELEEYEDSK